MTEFGVNFPRDLSVTDPVAMRDYAQAAESLGYTQIRVDDHVIGPLRTHPIGGDPQHLPHPDPLVLFAYLAAYTSKIAFVSAILVLPQRQTVIVAKQAAIADVLSNGRVKLGIAVGWNQDEYDVLNENFHNRGARMEEQVNVLRALWTSDTVDFHGKWHNIDGLGLNPMPVQRPIPIWMGGHAEASMRRAARQDDGWFVELPPGPRSASPETGAEPLERMRAYAKEAGRDPSTLETSAVVTVSGATPDDWRKEVEGWQRMGVTHLSIGTTADKPPTLAKHIETMQRFKEAVGF